MQFKLLKNNVEYQGVLSIVGEAHTNDSRYKKCKNIGEIRLPNIQCQNC